MAPQKLTTTIIAIGRTRKNSSTAQIGIAKQPDPTKRDHRRRQPGRSLVTFGLQICRKYRGPRRSPSWPHLAHDAMNSFHLRTMYWFSSITAFQQATAPMRS